MECWAYPFSGEVLANAGEYVLAGEYALRDDGATSIGEGGDIELPAEGGEVILVYDLALLAQQIDFFFQSLEMHVCIWFNTVEYHAWDELMS